MELHETPTEKLREELNRRAGHAERGECAFCGKFYLSPVCAQPAQHKEGGASWIGEWEVDLRSGWITLYFQGKDSDRISINRYNGTIARWRYGSCVDETATEVSSNEEMAHCAVDWAGR